MFEDIIERVAQEVDTQKYTKLAAFSVFAVHKPRIFERGENAAGGMIGQYVDGPYKEAKARLGRETAFVNLEGVKRPKGGKWTGSGYMKKDYQFTSEGVIGFGFSDELNFDKASGNEDRYGALIFALSEEEEELFLKLMGDYIFPDK